MTSKKRKRRAEQPTIHPRNKYSESPPDFDLLASLYSSFAPFVFYSRDGRPRIDWTNFNATRELTRVLLLHDHAVNWWIPDGQLCPTIPNRSNYIHWIDDLLSSDIIPKTNINGDKVRGFDIGTGANCIYPLLGATLLGWSFVGSDVTDVALEWAERNVKSNLHISELIEVRKVESCEETLTKEAQHNGEPVNSESAVDVVREVEAGPFPLLPADVHFGANTNYEGAPILLGVVKDDEKFDFCMCNPPFFESIEEAGLNPKTSCGGTKEEMVCLGGERAFITRIIEDSIVLKQSFRWYTSMVGRKTNLKFLISKLRGAGVTIVKTTEFVQGQTCRWGLAWSFVPPSRKIISSHVAEKNVLSFMLEGLQRQFSAIHVLQSVESFFCNSGAFCRSNVTTFIVDVTASYDHCSKILDEASGFHNLQEMSNGSLQPPLKDLCFRVSVFQQSPGNLLVKGSLQQRDGPVPGAFSLIFQRLEEVLKSKLCRVKAP